MLSWVIDVGKSLTIDTLFDEIEHYMGIKFQSRASKRELATITMKSDESVTEFYHRILDLWLKAKTPESERIENFIDALQPSISNSLIGGVFIEFRPLLEKARKVEDRLENLDCYSPRPDQRASLKKPGRLGRSCGLGGQSTASSSRQSGATRKKSNDHMNSKFSATAVKPIGWTGTWYDPDSNPGKLEEERAMLSRQGRCWACRGSGHRRSDSVCPQKNLKRPIVSRMLEVDSSSEYESETV